VSRRVAKLVTEVFAPTVLLAAVLVLIGWHAGSVALGVVAALFDSLLPFSYVVWQVRRGRLTDHHIMERTQRLVPFSVALALIAVGTVLLVVLHAPRELLAAVGAVAVGVVVTGAVNHWWKMSVHTSVAASTLIVLAVVYGPGLLLALPVVALVGWSRVVLTAHTGSQVVVGALVGGLVAGTVFAGLR
jgi:membrane-associated phospholipid phosphatase